MLTSGGGGELKILSQACTELMSSWGWTCISGKPLDVDVITRQGNRLSEGKVLPMATQQ